MEKAAGRKFPAILAAEVFEPAGMGRTRADSVFELIPGRARGYDRRRDGKLLNSMLCDTSYKIPGGGIVSTAEDLARFAVALQAGKLLERKTLELMWKPRKGRAGRRWKYGYGFQVESWNGCREVRHGGGQPRVSTLLYMLPDKGFALVLLTNLESTNLIELSRWVARTVLDLKPPAKKKRVRL
jgi:CubicO group peptidase (beta-lactamase class C family)